MKNYGRYYIVVFYVKYLEFVGVRVVLVRLDFIEKDYEIFFKFINGIFFFGGSVDFRCLDYVKVVKIFYNLFIQSFDDGDYFFVWGICFGFEEFLLLISGECLLIVIDIVDVVMLLNFIGG